MTDRPKLSERLAAQAEKNSEMNRALRGGVEDDATPPREGLPGPEGRPADDDSRSMNDRLRDALRSRRQVSHDGDG